jgi:hypothetical protein
MDGFIPKEMACSKTIVGSLYHLLLGSPQRLRDSFQLVRISLLGLGG